MTKILTPCILQCKLATGPLAPFPGDASTVRVIGIQKTVPVSRPYTDTFTIELVDRAQQTAKVPSRPRRRHRSLVETRLVKVDDVDLRTGRLVEHQDVAQIEIGMVDARCMHHPQRTPNVT